MARDTRGILNGIRTLVTEDNPKARVLGVDEKMLDADLDEVAGMYSQAELNRMVDSGVLSGEWKSTKTNENKTKDETEKATSFPEDFPGFDVLGQVEGMTPATIQAMSDEDVLKINGIGPATLKLIRVYGK